MYDYEDYYGFNGNNITEALIDGKVLKYDVCSSNIILHGEKYYAEYSYIGKGSIYSVGGVKQSYSDNNTHFFVHMIYPEWQLIKSIQD
jgi:hypothetical protein